MIGLKLALQHDSQMGSIKLGYVVSKSTINGATLLFKDRLLKEDGLGSATDGFAILRLETI